MVNGPAALTMNDRKGVDLRRLAVVGRTAGVGATSSLPLAAAKVALSSDLPTFVIAHLQKRCLVRP